MKNNALNKTTIDNFLVGILLLGTIFLFFGNFFLFYGSQHYTYLAKSFLEGSLHFTTVPPEVNWQDASYFEGKWFLPLGLFPTVVLLPFVALFGLAFKQGYLQFFLILINIFTLYSISLKITDDKTKSLFLTLVYIFGSAYFGVAYINFSWYFAMVVTSTCLLISIYYLLVNKNLFLSGLFFSLAFLSRISIILGIGFYIYYFNHIKNMSKKKSFFIPILVGICIFFTYNYVRFGDIMETGYTYQNLKHFSLLNANREYSMWNIDHFLSNIHILLLKGPNIYFDKNTLIADKIVPSKLGMSFLYTSPIFLLAFLSDLKKKINIAAIFGIFPILIFLLGSFGLGAYQYGYRFALDFQPFVFILLATYFKNEKLKKRLIVLLFISFIFNFFMINLLMIYGVKTSYL